MFVVLSLSIGSVASAQESSIKPALHGSDNKSGFVVLVDVWLQITSLSLRVLTILSAPDNSVECAAKEIDCVRQWYSMATQWQLSVTQWTPSTVLAMHWRCIANKISCENSITNCESIRCLPYLSLCFVGCPQKTYRIIAKQILTTNRSQKNWELFESWVDLRLIAVIVQNCSQLCSPLVTTVHNCSHRQTVEESAPKVMPYSHPHKPRPRSSGIGRERALLCSTCAAVTQLADLALIGMIGVFGSDPELEYSFASTLAKSHSCSQSIVVSNVVP